MKFAERIRALFGGGKKNDSFYDDLADLLVEGDLGAKLAFEISDTLKSSCRRQGIDEEKAIKLELKRILLGYGREISIVPEKGRLNIVLVLGINGVGKTTSCAKLANYYKKNGLAQGIVLAAADTFRAAAIDQIKIHGDRLGLRVVAQEPGSDPGAVIFDAIEAAKADHADLVIADTAGRMHTRQDLVRELGKIDKIVSGRSPDASYRRLIAIDATTGQNGLRQAETFGAAVPIDGVILTKLDSSAKGGIAIALAAEQKLPTAFLGSGEGYDDLAPFKLDPFLDSFLGIE